MAMLDILIPEGDPQQGILELSGGTLNPPIDMISSDGMEELILNITGYGGG